MNININNLQGKKCPKCDGTGKLFDPAQVANLIQEFCQQKQIVQNQFAEKLGVSFGFMSKLMNGKRRWTPALVNKALKIIEEHGK